VERWHQRLRRELIDAAGPFADLPSAQAAITAWVHAYNHARPHQALDMATPASLFRPGTQPEPVLAAPASPAPDTAGPAGPVPVLLGAQSAGAVEFDTVISASGVLGVIPAVQRIKLGPARAGQLAHVWADEYSIHVLIGGQLVKTVPSSLNAEDLATLTMRGARPAGPPPAAPAPAKAGALPGGTVIEVDRNVDGNGTADLAGHRVKVGPELARRRVTLRLDGHLVHVISGGVLAKTLPSPIPAAGRATLRGGDRRGRAAAARSRPGQRPAQGPPRRRHHGHPPAATRRRHLRREDRHRPRRGHPLPRHLRRRRDLLAPPHRAAPRHPVGSQDPRHESRGPVQHLVSLSTMW
jgi:Integrase core domain